MAVVLRLARVGRTKRAEYRIVATERMTRRDSDYLEILGTYRPVRQPTEITLKDDRARHWIENGAKASRVVGDIIKKRMPGLLEARGEHQRKKIQDARRARKARAKKSAK